MDKIDNNNNSQVEKESQKNNDGNDNLSMLNTENILINLLNENPESNIKNILEYLVKNNCINTKLDNDILCNIICSNTKYLDYYIYIINRVFPRFNINELSDLKIKNISLLKAFLDCGWTNIDNNLLCVDFLNDNHYFKKIVKLMKYENLFDLLSRYIEDIKNLIDNNRSTKNIELKCDLIIICIDELNCRKEHKNQQKIYRYCRILCDYILICKDFYNDTKDIPYGNDINNIIIKSMSTKR